MKERILEFCRCGLPVLLLGLAVLQPVWAAEQNPPALDKKNMDLAVRPGDDFYRYANGTWIQNLAMPADKSETDSFDQVREQNRARLRELFESLAASAATALKGTAAQKVGDFYATAMDTAKIEALGVKPLQEDFALIAKAATNAEIQDLLAGFHRENFPTLFGAGVEVDLMNSKAYAFYLAQSGLGMPDRDYYTRDDDEARTRPGPRDRHAALAGRRPGKRRPCRQDGHGHRDAAGFGIQDPGGDARYSRLVQQDDPGAITGTKPRV
jgi:hypothetical protein